MPWLAQDWARNYIFLSCLLLHFVPIQSYEMDDNEVLVVRPQRENRISPVATKSLVLSRFSFGLGKRSSEEESELMEDLR